MRITQLQPQLLRIPLARPLSSPTASDRYGRIDHVMLLVVHVDTDAGHRGLGFAYSLQGGGRAMLAIAQDDLAPLVVGQDPLDHERIAAKVYWRMQSIGRRGLVQQVYSAVDLALWDIKAKAAGLPLYKLLGGSRDQAPIYASDIGWLWMSPTEIIDAARPCLEQGMMGIKVKVGSSDPGGDADKLTQIREMLGDEIWLAVDANQRYDVGTALAMGRFFEEEIGVDWFEEPISCEDVDGHARLIERLDTPIALGENLFAADEFQRYLSAKAADVLQPDVTRVGGLTPFLKIAALAEQHHRPVAPHLMPEVAVHLACGLPNVKMVEYMPWHYPAFVEPPAIENGHIIPPNRPGLGLEINEEAVQKYVVSGK